MKKFVAVAGLLTCTMGMVATPAIARVNVDLHIGVGTPGVYVYPAPVYAHPQPLYVQPQPVYVQPYPVYVHPAPVFEHHQHWHVPSGHPRHSGHSGNIRHVQPYASGNYPYGDRDRDGVPNRWDYRPHNPYRH